MPIIRLVVSGELEVFGVAEEDLASSETVTDGLDYEVPDDREVENPMGRLMVTVDVSSWGRSFPCKVCCEGLVDKAGLR